MVKMKKLHLLLILSVLFFSCGAKDSVGRYQLKQFEEDWFIVVFDTQTGTVHITPYKQTDKVIYHLNK